MPPTGSGRELTRALISPDLLNRWMNRPHSEMSFHLTQLLTGHGCFNWFLKRFGRAPSDGCSHCGPPDGYGEEEGERCGGGSSDQHAFRWPPVATSG